MHIVHMHISFAQPLHNTTMKRLIANYKLYYIYSPSLIERMNRAINKKVFSKARKLICLVLLLFFSMFFALLHKL